jgi:SAM-dependent MidA family methyltransferase
MSHTSSKQHSLTLQNLIRDRIEQEKSISFKDYMQMVLYQPGFGYYSSGSHKFGEQGDFVTAPEIGPLFAETLAQQFKSIIETIPEPVIVELGAGTGQFCCDCLLALERQNALPEKYYILEVSADLQDRQKQKIKALPEHLCKRVQWIQQPLSQAYKGIIFANEVLDALPVELFRMHNGSYQQLRVIWDEGFKKQWQSMPTELNQQLQDKALNLSEGYVSEFVPNLSAWLKTITENLEQGVVLFVDYGYDRSAYYHPQRNEGTLICFHQHQANFDYFENIGLQDITAFVDFTAVAQAADDSGLSVDGYTTQAHFLISLEIQNLLGEPETDYEKYYKSTTEMKKLTLPNEMGEKFKVIALSRNFDSKLKGFDFSNQLHLL